MASGDQIKALVQSFISSDSERFKTIALQVAAREARSGHTRLANELKELIANLENKSFSNSQKNQPIPIIKPRGELSDLLQVSYPTVKLSNMVLESKLAKKLNRILKEQKHSNQLQSMGLNLRRRLLLTGNPGTGKTMTASALACTLGVPLFLVRLENLFSKYLGETASKLRLIFDSVTQIRGVYLFDEFDSIGFQRDKGNDVGEMRRVLNSFLIYLESDQSNSLLIAATNHASVLDYALFRRFDDVLEYHLPDEKLIMEVIENRLLPYKTKDLDMKLLSLEAKGLSYAEICKACDEAAKDMIMNGNKNINTEDVLVHLKERIEYRKNLNG